MSFLHLTENEYAPKKTENRLRASDWFTLFAEQGFDLIGREFVTYRSAQDQQRVLSENAPSGEPWVTNDMRQAFASPFHTKDLADLSVVGLRVLYRKPL